MQKPPEPDNQQQPLMGINLALEGMMISVSEPMMNQIVLKWLEAHEELARMFVATYIAKQRELQSNILLMEQIKQSKRE